LHLGLPAPEARTLGEQEPELTPAERLAMAARGSYLAAVFLPFLLLAPLLFLLSAALLRWGAPRARRLALVTPAPPLPPTAAGSGGLPDAALRASAASAAATADAAVTLAAGAAAKAGAAKAYDASGAVRLGTPVAAAAAAAAVTGDAGAGVWAVAAAAAVRGAAWRLLLTGVRCGGAAFIKWGQWSATREDMFPAVRRA